MIQVSPVAQQNQGHSVVKAPQTHDKAGGADVIVIDEESPWAATTTAASAVETESSVQAVR